MVHIQTFVHSMNAVKIFLNECPCVVLFFTYTVNGT